MIKYSNFWGAIVWGAIFPGSNFPGGIFPGGNFLVGFFPGGVPRGIFPDTSRYIWDRLQKQYSQMILKIDAF